MTAVDNSQRSSNPDLVPVSDLPGEWVENYLNEGPVPRGEKLSTWLCDYSPQDVSLFRFTITSKQIDRVEQMIKDLKLGAEVVDDPGAAGKESVSPGSTTAAGAEAGDAEDIEDEISQDAAGRNLPELDLAVDPEDANYVDVYYATLLREHPEHVLMTLEFPAHEQAGDEPKFISIVIDPPMAAGETHHYLSKFQTGASADVSASQGSVTLEFWRIIAGPGIREIIGIRTAVGGVLSNLLPMEHSSQNMSTYDISVVGNQNDNFYEVTAGFWDREF